MSDHFIEAVAKVCHEANRALCQAFGDTSHKAWEDAPEWQRETMRRGVAFHLANPEAGPEASHEEWMRVKLLAGWEYGPIKNEKIKTHPCLVAFEKLPKEQQAKDFLIRAIVHAHQKPSPCEIHFRANGFMQAEFYPQLPEKREDAPPAQQAGHDAFNFLLAHFRGQMDGDHNLGNGGTGHGE